MTTPTRKRSDGGADKIYRAEVYYARENLAGVQLWLYRRYVSKSSANRCMRKLIARGYTAIVKTGEWHSWWYSASGTSETANLPFPHK